MYLNNSKITAMELMNGILIAVLGISCFFHVFLIVFLLFSKQFGGSIASFAVAAFFFLLLAGSTVIIGFLILRVGKMRKARVYNSLLEEDHDGIITYETISSMTGFSLSRVINDLIWLRNNNYLKNVTVGRSAVRVDLISDEHEFITVSCPSCSNHVQIRRNGGGRCDHCGTFMRLKEDGNVQE